MKKSFLYILAASALFTGCLKDDPNTNFANLEPLAEISTSSLNGNLGAPSSGLDYFKQATLPSFVSDDPFEVTFNVNITGEYAPNKDINVTLAVDDNLRTSYNAGPKTQSNGVTFDAMPDSVYTFATKTATIKAGSRLAEFKVTFDPTKYDPSKSYLLPIKISDASGLKVSGNLGAIYIHNLGNKLAGVYTVKGTRWNYVGSVTWDGSPASLPVPGNTGITNMGATKLAAPNDTKTVELLFANVGSDYRYQITWDGDPTHSLSIGYTFSALYSNFQVVLVSFTPPDATHKAAFHIITHYNNALGGAGNDRIIDEDFTHN